MDFFHELREEKKGTEITNKQTNKNRLPARTKYTKKNKQASTENENLHNLRTKRKRTAPNGEKKNSNTSRNGEK